MLSKHDQEILNDLNSMAARGVLSGIFSDIPADVYHKSAGISSSQLKPYYARIFDHEYKTPNESDALRFGRAVHTYILEPHLFSQIYQVGFTRVDARELITPPELYQIKEIAAAFNKNSSAVALITGAQRELTCFSVCPRTGILQKARADALKIDGSIIHFSDIKTTSEATKSGFTRSSHKYLYRLSAAYYIKVFGEVLKKDLGEILAHFYLIACTKESSVVRTFKVNEESINKGSSEVQTTLEVILREKEIGEAVWAEYDSRINEIAI